MQTLTETRVHDAADAVTLADTLNAALVDGSTVTVNGVTVSSRHDVRSGRAVTPWGSGSVSFPVRAASRGARADRTVWVKPGQTVTVKVTG